MADDGPRLVETGDGPSLFFKGRWLYSRVSPRSAARKAAGSAEVLGSTLYLVPSPCLCHGLAELADALPADSAILCVEDDPALLALATRSLETSWPRDRRRPAIASTAAALPGYREAEAGIAPARLRRVVEVRLSGGRSLAEAAYDAAAAAIRADMAIRYRNRLAMVRMGRLWLRNTIANLASMPWERCAPLDSGGRLVVACGAGPSLDGAVATLLRHRDSLFVLACDTAAGALAQAGIVPDAVVCLESQVYNVSDYLPLGRRETAHAIDLSAHPSTFRAADGPLTIVASEWMDGPFMSRLAAAGLPIIAVPPLGSVGVLALRIARSFGGPFALAGLDFSFPVGRTHCLGSPTDLAERRAETRLTRRAGAYRASFRDGTEAIRSGWRSDPALSMYAALAASELADTEAYDLRSSMAVGLPTVPWPLSASLGAVGLAAGDPGRAFGLGDDGSATGRARAFLAGEAARVAALAAMLRSGASKDELASALADSDFLYAHFPDPERVAALESDALKRVAAEAAYWAGRLDEALGA